MTMTATPGEGSRVQVLEPREVPLGGIRAITVRRTLPHRERSFIGAWCFVDHYGPTAVEAGNEGGMDVPPHPHAGLQTVSWLFSGEIEHRDSGGVVGLVRPGEVNLMRAGHGIAHSEVSTTATRVLHGVQLWVAQPEGSRDGARGFRHHVPVRAPLVGHADGASRAGGATGPEGGTVAGGGVDAGSALVFVGCLNGVASSPVPADTPLLGAQLDLAPGADVELVVEAAFEHAVLLDEGSVEVDGVGLRIGDLGCLDPGPDRIRLRAGATGARILLLGGEPFEEEIVMWWNFVGRSHEEIAGWREEWEAGSARFGTVPGYVGTVDRVPAPRLPGVRLRPRGRLGRRGG